MIMFDSGRSHTRLAQTAGFWALPFYVAMMESHLENITGKSELGLL